jgi:hypothetical protein
MGGGVKITEEKWWKWVENEKAAQMWRLLSEVGENDCRLRSI